MIFLKFNSFLTEAKLNEIGEGSKPFDWRRIGPTKIGGWMSDISMVDKADTNPNWTQLPNLQYEFKSENAEYIVSIAGGWKRHIHISFSRRPNAPKPQDFDLVIVVSFNTKNSEGEAITNFGEQFRVVTTVTEIMESVVKEITEWEWIKLQEIRIFPKLEDGEGGKPMNQTKRGRLYFEYIKKQGRRLPGNWTVETGGDGFVIHRGQRTGSNYTPIN